MRIRFVAIGILSFLLSACGQKLVELPSGEVLRRAVLTSQTTDSVEVAFRGQASLVGEHTLSGSVTGTGVLRTALPSWSLHLSLHVKNTRGRILSGTVILASPLYGSVFLRPLSLSTSDGVPLPSATETWWALVTSSGATRTVTPDPSIAESIASMFVVERGGLDPDSASYHYVVHVVPETFQSGSSSSAPSGISSSAIAGELWIDARSFHVTRVVWNVASLPLSFGHFTGNIHIDFSSFNRAPFPEAPTSPSFKVSPEAIYAIFFGD